MKYISCDLPSLMRENNLYFNGFQMKQEMRLESVLTN